jgi:hypothetical protein
MSSANSMGGRVLLAAGAADVDLDLAQVESVHGVEDEVDKMIAGHPVAQIGGQEQRGVPVNGNEANGHGSQTRPPCGCSIRLPKHRAFYTSRGHRLSFFELLKIQGQQRL